MKKTIYLYFDNYLKVFGLCNSLRNELVSYGYYFEQLT